jgi:vacuolar-type H+-ATPase subunit I/STV1
VKYQKRYCPFLSRWELKRYINFYLEAFMDIKRYHTHKKEILRFADLDLKSYGMEKEFADFIAYVDDIDRPNPDALSVGQWKKLFALLRKLSDKMNINYCIYQNKSKVFFDITSNCIGTEDEISEEKDGLSVENFRQSSKESSIDKLKRYKYEVDQIDLKIAHLQERRKEYLEKIEPLKMELATVLDELSGYGG